MFLVRFLLLFSSRSVFLTPFLLPTGLDALAYDPNKFALDYHSIGFRECAAEVARYLVTVEGMDIQDPLRMRLMSHLQVRSDPGKGENSKHGLGKPILKLSRIKKNIGF